MPSRALVICATPRSGSTLLCELLGGTGVAGRPEEYFEARADTGMPPHPGDYLAGLPRTGAGVRDDATPPEAPPHSSLLNLSGYREHLERTLRLGTTPNGVFATKLMWGQIADLQALSGQLPDLAGKELPELMTAITGVAAPVWVWISREDKVRQAISLWKALQTRTWRLAHPGDGRSAELHYSFEAIDHLARLMQTNDAAWGQLFDAHGIAPLRLVYERDLESAPEGAIGRVLAALGVQAPQWHAPPPLHRQADAVSEEWISAYHRELADGRA